MIAAVADELRAVARASGDASGYFAAMYARVTSSIAQNRFDDGERMDRLATTFAGYYTRCLGPVPTRPGCWKASFDVVGRKDLLILQHLLIGINAHVNHDLPQAVVDVASTTGDLQSVKGDFDAINDILGTMTIELLKDLDRVSRWANAAGALGGTRVFNFSLKAARDQAWGAAERLFALPPAERPREVAEIDRLVRVLAYLITKPRTPAKLLVPLARRFEERDPKKVTAALLGDRAAPSP